MRNYFLINRKESLFKYYWLTTFFKWFSFVFLLFFFLFWINQVLFLGKSFLPLNFSITSIFLLGFCTLPFIGDMIFPIIIFLSLFWLLSYLTAQKEVLAWQNAGVPSNKIIFFLFRVIFIISLSFFFISDFMQAFSLSSQKKIFQNWESSLLGKMKERDIHIKIGDLELFNIRDHELLNFYILYPLKEHQRSFFLLQGKSGLEVEGISLYNSSFFSPAESSPESYYQGEINSLSLKIESFFESLDNTFSSYFLPFSQLSYHYLIKSPSLKKEHIFLWHQKIINLVSSWILGLLTILFSFKKAKEGQSTYPFWQGLLLAMVYIFLILLFRILFFYFWDKSLFILLWAPVVILLGLLPFARLREIF